MGMFTKVEPAEELEKILDVTGEIRDFVRHQHSPADGQAVASDLASLIKRVTASSVSEIDHVIAHLQMLRKKLEGDAARVQRELAEYAAFGESTLQSMNVISDCLRNRFPKAQFETGSRLDGKAGRVAFPHGRPHASAGDPRDGIVRPDTH